MGKISPLVPLWLDLTSLANNLARLETLRSCGDTADERADILAQVERDIGMMRTRLARGDARELSRMDGKDHRPWVADVAMSLQRLSIGVGLLAEPQFDTYDLNETLSAIKHIRSAEQYVRALERVDDETFRDPGAPGEVSEKPIARTRKKRPGRRENPERDSKIYEMHVTNGKTQEATRLYFRLGSASAVSHACKRHKTRQKEMNQSS